MPRGIVPADHPFLLEQDQVSQGLALDQHRGHFRKVGVGPAGDRT